MIKKKGGNTKKTNTTKKGDDMRDLFFIVKGQYSKVTPKFINPVTGNETFLGGYDPNNENTVEWYMLLDRKTYRCCVCGTSLEKCLKGVHDLIITYKGVGKNYFKQISRITSDDYYEVHYLGHKPLTPIEREKKGKNKYPRVSPIMRAVYAEVDKMWGDYYEDQIREMEDLAYEELKEEKPVFKSRKLMSKHKVKTPTMETTPKHTEVIDSTPKKLVKPKVKMGVKKLKME